MQQGSSSILNSVSSSTTEVEAAGAQRQRSKPDTKANVLSESLLESHDRGKERDVVAVLPPDEHTAFDRCSEVLEAAADAEGKANGRTAKLHPDQGQTLVDIVYDEELEFEAVDILGKNACLNLRVKCSLPYLVLQVNDLDKFCSVDLTVVDMHRRVRKVSLTNRQTMTRVQDDSCSMPLVMVKGWNYVNLDLPDISRRAFGVDHKYCKCISIHGSLRVGKVYFQREVFDDSQLPEFLRVAH